MNIIAITIMAFIGAVASANAADINVIRNASRQLWDPATRSYITVYGGTTVNDSKKYGVVGGNVGTKVGTLPVNAEVAYDHMWHNKSNRHNVMLNAVPYYKVSNTPITVYGLAGVGYRFDTYSNWNNSYKVNPQWNVGAGMQANITENIIWDTRYRHMDTFKKMHYNGNKVSGKTDVITTGIMVKF